MEKSKKKLLRSQFRTAVFTRDKHRCRCCGTAGSDRQSLEEDSVALDAHHITNRKKFLNGGYVKENGITVCDDCHLLVEEFLTNGHGDPKHDPVNLYIMIGSSLELAHEADLANSA